MAEPGQAYGDVVICVMCIVVSISLSAALPVVEPGQHSAGVIKVSSLHALSSSPHVANEAANEATVDIQVGAASRPPGGPSKDCRDSLIACVRKGRNTRACRKELPCVSTCCSNNIGPTASTLALPVKIESKNGTLPVENSNRSDAMPDATTEQAHRTQVDQSSTVPPRQVPRPDSIFQAPRGSGSADQILDEGMHPSTGPASATLSGRTDDLAAHPTDKPLPLLHWLPNRAGALANWLAGASGSSAQQAKALLLQLSNDKEDKGGEGGSGGAPIGLIAAGFGGGLVLFVVVGSASYAWAVWMRKSRAREERLKRQQSGHRRVERHISPHQQLSKNSAPKLFQQLSKNSAPKLFQSMDLKHEGSTNGSGSAVPKDGLRKATSGLNNATSENSTSKAVARTQAKHPEESLLPNAETIMHISAQATRHETDPVDELVIGSIIRHEEHGEGELIEIDLDNLMYKPYLVIFKHSGHEGRYTRQQLKDHFELHRILPSDPYGVAEITPSAPPSLDTKPSFKRRGGAIQTTEVATHVEVDVDTEHGGHVHHTLTYLPGDDPPRIGPTLVVHVDSARNLTAKDDNGTSDPFCEVEYGKETRKTNICLKSLNPAWHATFRFELQYRARLLLTVWDDATSEGGTEKDNKFLGKLEFKPQKLEVLKEAYLADESGTCDEWYPLHKRSMMSHISGDIRIRLTWEDFRDL